MRSDPSLHPVLVFDIGGVLVESPGYDALRELLASDRSDQQMRSLWLDSPAVQRFETGRTEASVFAEELVAELGLPISAPEFLERFIGWPGDFFPGALDLLAQLRTTHQLGCLSNSNPLHWRAQFENLFDFVLSSHRIGAVKPSAEAFRALVEVVERPPGEVFFFDDSETNVEAARGAGLRAFHTVGFEELVATLIEMRILDLAPGTL